MPKKYGFWTFTSTQRQIWTFGSRIRIQENQKIKKNEFKQRSIIHIMRRFILIKLPEMIGNVFSCKFA